MLPLLTKQMRKVALQKSIGSKMSPLLHIQLLLLLNCTFVSFVGAEQLGSKSAFSHKSPCFLRNSTFSRDIVEGEWKVLPADTNVPKCLKTEGTERSCTKKKNKSITAPRIYEPFRCLLPDFDAHKFLHDALRGRPLYFVGDSVIMQQKTRLECELNGHNRKKYEIKSIRISHLEHFRRNIGRLRRIPDGAIILFNVGLHYNQPEEYFEFLSEFEKVCLRKACTNGTLIWQETSAQHFPGSKNGLFVRRGKCSRGCSQLDRGKLVSVDFRNKMANELMLRNNIQILPVWELTQAAHSMHVQYNSKSGICDCTHFCNLPYGVFRAYNRILQAFLLDIL